MMKLCLKILFWITAVVALGYLFLFNRSTQDPITATAEPSETQNTSFNILLLGCDASGVRPDSIMLMQVGGKDNTVVMLSLPRDSRVVFGGRNMKLNTVMVKDGIEAMEQMVEQLTGVEVDYYICMKAGIFGKLVDALGGMDYNVEQNMVYHDPAQDLHINLQAGWQHLNGDQCEQYCRYRQYAMGDLSRTQHQQKLLSELIRQKMSLRYIVKLPGVYNVIRENAVTNLSLGDVSSYLPLLRSMSEGGVSFKTVECPGAYNDMEKEKISYYLIDQEKLQQLCQREFTTT